MPCELTREQTANNISNIQPTRCEWMPMPIYFRGMHGVRASRTAHATYTHYVHGYTYQKYPNAWCFSVSHTYILESNSKQTQYEYALCVFLFVYERQYLLYTHKRRENTEQIDIEEQFSNEVKLFIWASLLHPKILVLPRSLCFPSCYKEIFIARV